MHGEIVYGDIVLNHLNERAMRAYRGSKIGMIFQDPMTALNPVMRVGDAIAQVIGTHTKSSGRKAKNESVHMMERVGIINASARSRDYPHQFSGGMRQRIVIAIALAAKPSVLLADEPTTALDVITQAEILRLIDRLRREDGMSLLLVSHDLGVVANVCDDLGVMYSGELVELGPTRAVLAAPRHPYTRGLLDSLPDETSAGVRLRPIRGSPPDPVHRPSGVSSPALSASDRGVSQAGHTTASRWCALVIAVHPCGWIDGGDQCLSHCWWSRD
jgi:ABC-type dipeptide/oligopeptide/nickel transport system ATPase component